MKGFITLNNPVETHEKPENLKRFFKLASLYRPDQSSAFMSYISSYEPKENEENEQNIIEGDEEQINEYEEEEKEDYE